jgi:ABC-2 type transport system ATP-binding protein
MSEPLLSLRDVTKTFRGRAAVDGLSFDVHPGEIFALLGPNGAGKTTTVRMLVGILAPDSGTMTFDLPRDARGRPDPTRTAYLPEDRGLWRDQPVLGSLVYLGALRGLSRGEAGRRAEEWLTRLDLFDRRNDKVETLSKGNQQRIQLAAAVLHRPAFAILDEPFSGLDPISQDMFLGLFRTIREEGTTVLLSAHQMDLVERAADRVLLMNRGREILSGSIDELRRRHRVGTRLRIVAEDAIEGDPMAGLEGLAAVEKPSERELVVTLEEGRSLNPVLARAAASFAVRSVAVEEPRLHDVFVEAVRRDGGAPEEM